MTTKDKNTTSAETDGEGTAAAVDLTSKIVELDEPIKRGNQVIDKVTIRKPGSGELRGVSLMALGELDVQALQKVLPRVTAPTLTSHDVSVMDPADLLQCGMVVAAFLLKKAQRQEAFQTA